MPYLSLRSARALVLSPLLAFIACGSDVTSTPDAGAPLPDASPVDAAPVDAGPGDASTPVELRPVTIVTATNDVVEHVRVTWVAPSTAATGYRLLRDGKEIARVTSSVTSFDDTTATTATLLAPTVNATVTVRTGIDITWEPSAADGGVASHAYAVVAVYASGEAPPSESKRGSRPGPITGWELTRADGTTRRLAVGVREFADTEVPRATVTLAAPTVSVDAPRSLVNLALPALPTVTPAATVSYRVRAIGGALFGAYSAVAEGRRGSGAPNEVDFQWQRSSGSSRRLLEFESGGELMATRLGGCRQRLWGAERESRTQHAL